MQIEVWALFVDEVILAELNCSFFFSASSEVCFEIAPRSFTPDCLTKSH